MSSLCLQAADLLAGDGVQAEVVHLASIKPIDCELIIEFGLPHGLCGDRGECFYRRRVRLRSYGSDFESCPVPVRRIGVQDRWVDSGGIDELFTFHHMQPQDIAQSTREVIRSEKMPGKVS